MNDLALPASAALAVGVLGLLACSVAMSHVLPTTQRRWWRRRRRSALRVPPPRVSGRRVVTGAPAIERLAIGAQPTRHPTFNPDVLHGDRERLGIAESRRIIEQVFDEDPMRLAGVVQRMLAEDRRDA
jgi:hypothetical protein